MNAPSVTSVRWIAVLLAAVLAIAEARMPDRAGWGFGILGVLLAGEAAAAWLRGRQADAPGRWGDSSDVYACLGGGLVRLAGVLGVPMEELAIHAFRAQRRWSWPLSRRLVNIGSIRVRGQPWMHRPVWLTGVVGRAFEAADLVIEDWARFYADADNGGEQAWTERTKHDRYGLSWRQLQATARYAVIVAYPIVDPQSGRPVGCIVVDGPIAVDSVDRQTLRGVLNGVSVFIHRASKPSMDDQED